MSPRFPACLAKVVGAAGRSGPKPNYLKCQFPIAAMIALAAVTGPAAVTASEPIYIEYGRGHRAAMNLAQDAEAHLKKGNLEQALHSADAAVKSDPGFWPALYTRAKIYRAQRKWQLAIQDCNELLRQYPYLVEASLLRANVNGRMGRYAESLKEINHVVAIRPRTDGLARALAQRAWFRLTCPDPSFRDSKQ